MIIKRPMIIKLRTRWLVRTVETTWLRLWKLPDLRFWHYWCSCWCKWRKVGQVVHTFTCLAYSHVCNHPFLVPWLLDWTKGAQLTLGDVSQVQGMGRNVRCLWQWACRASPGRAVTWALVTSLSSTSSQCGQSRRTGTHPGVVASRAPEWNCRRTYNSISLESDSQGSLSRLQVLHSSKALPANPSTHFRPSQTLRGKAQPPR